MRPNARRVERQVLRLNDELISLRRDIELMEGELWMHRHLADDAARDAAITDSPFERAEARQTTKDVLRLESALSDARQRAERLERKRDDLLSRFT